ncbi:MAG: helix-turn-helix transcriptional regulator [Candidatus Thorarchaeota archaeon]
MGSTPQFDSFELIQEMHSFILQLKSLKRKCYNEWDAKGSINIVKSIDYRGRSMIRQDQIRNEILKMLGNSELHGYDIHGQLEKRGIKLRIGRLYEILNQMSSEGLLMDNWQPSASGPQKRVYGISSKGNEFREKILMDAIQTVHEFYGEYLRSLPAEKGAFSILSKILLEGLGNAPVIAFVSMKSSKAARLLLSTILDTSPKATIYFVGPREIFSDMDLGITPNLEGTCSNIPSKDDYFDLVVLPGFSALESVIECLDEWYRVVNKSGKVAIVTPTALVKKIEDPMSIGEFIEQKEHPSEFEGETSPESLIVSEFEKRFTKVERKSVVHISVIIGYDK